MTDIYAIDDRPSSAFRELANASDTRYSFLFLLEDEYLSILEASLGTEVTMDRRIWPLFAQMSW